MSKWRPSSAGCLYVIPDIHGQYKELELILSRILPLRKTDGVVDTIVFLGDYIDRGIESHKVLDKLIEIKNQYKDQVVFLRGNHEQMFLDAMQPSMTSNKYLFWMKFGGDNTFSGYLQRAGQPHEAPYEVLRTRLKDFVPPEHIEFIRGLRNFYETDTHIFVHGGCNPIKPLEDQEPEVFLWDRTLYGLMCSVDLKTAKFPWKKTIVTGHNSDVEDPFIHPKFMMLDCSSHKRLIVYEINSGEGFIAKQNNDRLVKLEKKNP